MTPASWHASPKRDALPSIDHPTGEVRVPVVLYDVDQGQAVVPLVLSRREAERLRNALTALLSPTLVRVSP